MRKLLQTRGIYDTLIHRLGVKIANYAYYSPEHASGERHKSAALLATQLQADPRAEDARSRALSHGKNEAARCKPGREMPLPAADQKLRCARTGRSSRTIMTPRPAISLDPLTLFCAILRLLS